MQRLRSTGGQLAVLAGALLCAVMLVAESASAEETVNPGSLQPHSVEFHEAGPGATVTIVDVDGTTIAPAAPLDGPDADGVLHVALPVLPSGDYTITARWRDGARIVSEQVVVHGENTPGLAREPHHRRTTTWPVFYWIAIVAALCITTTSLLLNSTRQRRERVLGTLTILAAAAAGILGGGALLISAGAFALLVNATTRITTGDVEAPRRAALLHRGSLAFGLLGAALLGAGAGGSTGLVVGGVYGIAILLSSVDSRGRGPIRESDAEVVSTGLRRNTHRHLLAALLSVTVLVAAVAVAATSVAAPGRRSPTGVSVQSCLALQQQAATDCLAAALGPRLRAGGAVGDAIAAVEEAERRGVYADARDVNGCHLIGHYIGASLIHRDDLAAVAVEVGNRCNWGYVHGMTDQAALSFSNEAFTAFITRLCAVRDTHDYRTTCNHGSGHASYARSGGDLRVALSLCAQLDEPASCSEGAVMTYTEQYVRANRAGSWENILRPIESPEDAYTICPGIEPGPGRDACLRWSMRQYPTDHPETAANARRAAAWCNATLPDDAFCAEGVAIAMVPNGPNPDGSLADAVCGAFRGQRSHCMDTYIRQALDNLTHFSNGRSTDELFDAVCRGVRDHARCIDRARQSTQ